MCFPHQWFTTASQEGAFLFFKFQDKIPPIFSRLPVGGAVSWNNRAGGMYARVSVSRCSRRVTQKLRVWGGREAYKGHRTKISFEYLAVCVE